MSYLDQAQANAKDAVIYLLDEIAESYQADGEADPYCQSDSEYHHETHIDNNYNLQEAAEILDELSKFEESDEGLWQSLKPKDAIIAQAAYTYGNAVLHFFKEIVQEINDDDLLEDIYNSECDFKDEIIKFRIKQMVTNNLCKLPEYENLLKGVLQGDSPTVLADYLEENNNPESKFWREMVLNHEEEENVVS